MTDEQQIRSLLTLAAELPDDIEPPVRPLLDRARRERKLRAVLSLLSVVVIAAAAFALPPIVRALGPAQISPAGPRVPAGLFPAHPAEPPPGPSAAQLARFRWSALPPSPLGPVSQPVLAWTGHDLLELSAPQGGVTRNEGAAFNPATRTWRTIQVPNTIGLAGAVGVWTGQQLFVTNGRFPPDWAPGVGAPAGLYNPANNHWTFTDMPVELGSSQLSAAWTGRVIVVAGVSRGRIEAAAYNPATRHWSMISPTLPARHPARYIAMVATASRLILWSFWDRVKVYKHSASDRAGIDVLALSGGTWRDVTGRWPQEQDVASPIFTGHAILISPSGIWCGRICSPPPTFSHPGYVVNAVTLHRTAIPIGPLGQADPPFTWTGRAVIAIDLDVSGRRPALREDDMALWDPAADRWRHLPAPPGYPRLSSPPVWAGRQFMLLTASGGLLSFHG